MLTCLAYPRDDQGMPAHRLPPLSALAALLAMCGAVACKPKAAPASTDASGTDAGGGATADAPADALFRDTEPRTRGVGPEARAWDWFAAHGIARGPLLAWYRAQFRSCRPELAERLLDAPHYMARVGAPAEDVLYGEHHDECEIDRARAYLIAVRGGKPAVVLDVPLGLQSGDEDIHFVDLALVLAPDGLSAVLSDRAPDGTSMFEPTSWIAQREAHIALCEGKIDAGQPVQSQHVDLTGQGEPWCPLSPSSDGKRRVDREAFVALDRQRGHYPVTLRDCASAAAREQETLKNGAASDIESASARAKAIALSCAMRGTWQWRDGRFVRAGSTK